MIVTKPPSQDNDDGPNHFIKHWPFATAAAEVHTYLAAACELERRKPLEFWSENEPNFPILARMARAYLAIPAIVVQLSKVFQLEGGDE